jgi:hypothetical protein
MHFHTSQDAGKGFRPKHPNPWLHAPPPRLHAPRRRNSTLALHVTSNTQPPLLARGHRRSAPSSYSTPVNSSGCCCAAASAPRAGAAFHQLCSAPTRVDRDPHCRSTHCTPCTRPPLGRLLEPWSSSPAAAHGRPSPPQGHVALGRGGAAAARRLATIPHAATPEHGSAALHRMSPRRRPLAPPRTAAGPPCSGE